MRPVTDSVSHAAFTRVRKAFAVFFLFFIYAIAISVALSTYMHNPQLNSIRSHLFSGGFSRHSGQCGKLLTEGVEEEEEEGKGKTRSTKTVSYTISCGNDTQRTPMLRE